MSVALRCEKDKAQHKKKDDDDGGRGVSKVSVQLGDRNYILGGASRQIYRTCSPLLGRRFSA